VLTDVALDFGGLAVEELFPLQVPDLFSSTPVVVKGRYEKGGQGTITLRGKTGEGDFERKIDVTLPDEQPDNDVLAPLWARAKVDHLMHGDLTGIQRGDPDPATKEEILGLGLRYRLLTQFTSFVAVEKVRITEGGRPRTIAVPVEMPEGVSYEGVFGASARGRGINLATMARRKSAASYGGMALGKRMLAPSAARPAAPPVAKQGEAKSEDKEADAPGEKPDDSRAFVNKLAPELRGLAEKVAKEGTDGNLTIGKLQVKAGRVEIQVQLADLSAEVLAKLEKLGFKQLAQAKSVKLVIGTIDVKQLEALAKLAEVLRVTPSV